jgi:hypothetical protein
MLHTYVCTCMYIPLKFTDPQVSLWDRKFGKRFEIQILVIIRPKVFKNGSYMYTKYHILIDRIMKGKNAINFPSAYICIMA